MTNIQTNVQSTAETTSTESASTDAPDRSGAARHARRAMRPAATALAAAAMLAAAGASADAYERPAAKPAENPGPRAAALLVPSNTNFKLTPTLERATGFTKVTQPSVGVYCFAAKKKLGIADAVPVMSVEFTRSLDGSGMVQWLSDPVRFGCKPSELGAITLVPDGGGVFLRSNLVAFAIVVA